MTKRLRSIRSPQDLRGLNVRELTDLAAEIRQVTIDTLAETGGHLAPNLGVVELTLALHTVFDSPKDKLLWDVGHQSYIHKILTGRLEGFPTIRQHEGLSGFCKRHESPHDVWEAGHSSTSISGALGYAKARDLRGEDYAVVAIIGDGALTAGMAYEALNNAGHDGTDLIVVLNDNSMSIAPNVGAMSSYLNRLRTEPVYDRFKHDLERVLNSIPRIGSHVARTLERMKDGVKHMVLPGSLFEEMGFSYLGPVDGHDLEELQNALRYARQRGGPVMIHALTVKGKGYGPAERNPAMYHGLGPYDPQTGVPISKGAKPPKYSDVFGNTLTTIAERDPSIVAITAAMPKGTGLSHFAEAFPGRFFDVGIAEQHAVTFAGGLASGGLRPVVAIYSTFLQRAFDQIVHDINIQDLPVIFALDRAGIVGGDGETHQGLYDYAYLRILPNMVIMAPKDENELRHMLKTAAEYREGPIALRYPRGSGLGVPLDEELQALPIGKGETIREGTDIALVAVGSMVERAREAATQLAEHGVDAWVINARFVKPLDGELIIEAAEKTGCVVTLEEAARPGGFGSAVLELLNDKGPLPDLRTATLALGDEIIPHGDRDWYLDQSDLSVNGIVRRCLRLMGKDSDSGEGNQHAAQVAGKAGIE